MAEAFNEKKGRVFHIFLLVFNGSQGSCFFTEKKKYLVATDRDQENVQEGKIARFIF